jgi:Flp pilus assembly protein TadG
MRRAFRTWSRDARGVAVVEMALIAPVIAVLALLSFEVWQSAGRSEDMRVALKSAAQYYMNGGTDDAAARSLALSAWPQAPAGASVSVARSCACGAVANVCTSLCASGDPPAAVVSLTATATQSQAVFNKTLTEHRVVRVR